MRCATSVSLPRRSTASARIWSSRPERAETYNLLGNAYKEQGRLDEALEAYQRAMQFQPDLRDAHTNFLLASHYRPSLAAAELAALHVEWDDRHGSARRRDVAAPWEFSPCGAPLRLGFVSTDLGFHPVGYFLIRTFENLDRQAYTVTCYSDRNVVNPLSGRFRAAAANWQDTSERSDEAIADQIRRDEIDILFELSGHTYGNRLLVFARKPAPIQNLVDRL